MSKPLAYQLGEWDFYNITVKVTPDVLIPRPDSEHLVELTLAFLKTHQSPTGTTLRILDLCCGSGCIGLAIAANCPGVSVTYGDISEAALAVARSNGCEDVRIMDALQPPAEPCPWDILVCNPPYVAPGAAALDASVRDWEPPIALYGGEDGLAFYRSLLPGWLPVLKPGGLFAVEVGYDQAGTVCRMARDAGLSAVTVHRDYAGHDRVISGVR